jgi:hypothetical protein
MIASYYADYKELGLSIIPIEWNIEKKEPVSHRKWGDGKSMELYAKHNAIMVKTTAPIHCLDFDIKNTKNKNLYFQWFNILSNTMPDILPKLYIEKTRNAGYHVWLKYSKDLKKLSLADSDVGAEVIALYAGGPLVYTYPTPGYSIEGGSMEDLQELTDEEFNYLVESSQYFNEYKPKYDPNLKAIAYPHGLEKFCTEFDKNISDDTWIQILHDSGLIPLPNYKYSKKDKFVAFRRVGSESDAISAKVYFHTKRVMIFSASLHDYPNWHNKHDYPVWSLPPSFLLFYQMGRDWTATFEKMQMIADSEGLEIAITEYKGDFPINIFPSAIRNSILEVAAARSLAPEFLAVSGLWTISSMAGTHYTSDFNGDSKNILFCLLIAPVSVGKTPAYKSMCETPLQTIQESADKNYHDDIKEWEIKKSQSEKTFTEKKPRRFIPFAVDGTTEGYVALSMDQPNGIGVYHDEAETIFNAGSFKGTNDSISFFTQCFSGGRFTQVRADRDKERVVPNLNINLMLGTQPSRLGNIFTEDRLSSGFASRFIMVESDYIELNTEIDPFTKNKEMCQEWVDLLRVLYTGGQRYNAGEIQAINIRMDNEAKQAYREYYKAGLQDANKRILSKVEQYIIGTEAKMSAYFPRLVQILAIIHDPVCPVITKKTVEDAHLLYKYFAKSTMGIIAKITQEVDTGLPAQLELLYQALPETFAKKDAVEVCKRLNLTERKFEVAMRRKDFKQLFNSVEHGIYRKV